MRETRDDTVIALVLALLVHAIPLALIALSLLWPGRDAASAGEPIQADVVDMNSLSASMRSALRRPPEPLAEPVQEPPKETLPEALEEPVEETPPEQQLEPQEQIPDPQETQQEEVVADAETPEEIAEREQEAKRQQGQRDLTENRETQEEIEQRRLSEMERQRLQQLADIRRQREQAQRDRQQIEDRLENLATQRAQQASDAAAARAGNRGTESDPNAAYAKAIADAIRRNWIRPDNILPNQRCRIVIRQLPGGEVIDAQVDASCPYDELGRRSVEAAVLKAQPLPYAGFERAFQRTLILNFQAEDR